MQKLYGLILSLALIGIFNSANAQVIEVPTGPFLDSTNYIPPPPLMNKMGIINITNYKQCGQSWSNDYLGSCNNSICNLGCAMTDAAMLLKANGVSVDPGQLNTWLKNNGGYTTGGCDIYWNVVDNYPGATLSWYASVTFSLTTLKSEIDGGNPVIVHVDHYFGGSGTCGHFVLVYGYSNAGTSLNDFLVSDPGTINCTGCSLSNFTICSETNPLRVYHNVTPAAVPPTCTFNVKAPNASTVTLPADYQFWYTLNYTLSGTISNLPNGSNWSLYLFAPDGITKWQMLNNNSNSTFETVFQVPANASNLQGYTFRLVPQGNPSSPWQISVPFCCSKFPSLSIRSSSNTLIIGKPDTVYWNVTGGIPALPNGGWQGDIRLQWYQGITPLSNLASTPVSNNKFIFTVPSSISGTELPGCSFKIAGANSESGTTMPGGSVYAFTDYLCINNSITCNYIFNYDTLHAIAIANAGSFWVYTSADCDWTASTGGCSNMITLTNSSGRGNGLVTFNISANTNTSQRVCTISVQGKVFTIIQNGYVPPCSTTPAVPLNLTASVLASNEIYLSWEGNNLYVSDFEVERGLSETGPFTVIGSSGNNFSYNDKQIIGGTVYFYRVKACCNSNCSNYSNIASKKACIFSTQVTEVQTTADTIYKGESVTLTAIGGVLGTGAQWTWHTVQCFTGPIVGTGQSITASPDTSTYYLVKAENGDCQTTIMCAYKLITVLPTLGVPVITLKAMMQGFYNGSKMVSDTVTLELHNSSSSYALVESQRGVLDTTGVGKFYFSKVVNGTPYYLVIKHRNGLETWSSSPVAFSSYILNYDFTIFQNQAYGNDQVQVGTKWCIYSGDVNFDGVVDSGDLGLVDNDNANYVSGYTNTDVNGDGIVDSGDLSIVDNNNANYICKIVPPDITQCGVNEVNYAGKNYHTVKIGDQCWLKENLDVGTMILSNQDPTNNGIIEKYCYNDDPVYCTSYGGLYQWNETMQYVGTPGTQGICPTGWHIPTYSEFQTLATTVNNDGNALKMVGQGVGSGTGTNTSGFSALFSGYRSNWGYFGGLGNSADFWSSSESSAPYSYQMFLYYDGSNIGFNYDVKANGYIVRCLKN